MGFKEEVMYTTLDERMGDIEILRKYMYCALFDTGQTFLRLFRETVPFSRLLRHAWGDGWHILDLTPPPPPSGPQGGNVYIKSGLYIKTSIKIWIERYAI